MNVQFFRQEAVPNLRLSSTVEKNAYLLRAQHALTERARRFDYFRTELFADSAWDILLQLYCSELSEDTVTVTHVAEKVKAPSTTIIRWIHMLECDQLVARQIGPQPGGRVYLALTQKGLDAMHDYFREDASRSGSTRAAGALDPRPTRR